MKSKKEEIINEEVEEVYEDEKSVKTKRRAEKLEQRKKQKKKDVIERFSGVVFVALIFLIGLLLWVGGMVSKNTSAGVVIEDQDRSSSFPSSRVIME
jgi:cytoskeletal protein RodZ